MSFALRLFVVGAFLCQLGFSQTDPWERVKLIEKGKGVFVTLVSGNTVSGKMDEWQPDGLVVRKGREAVSPRFPPSARSRRCTRW